jgi:hypothetical protein
MNDESHADDPAVGTAPCNCGIDELRDSVAGPSRVDRRTGEPSPLREPLPGDLQIALGRLLGEGPIERLDEWIEIARRHTGGGGIGIDDLCHAPEASGHWAAVDGERYDFLCFYDAVILAALVDEPVAIRTASPDGTVIEAIAAGTADLQVTPAGAVFSFGVAESVEPPADGSPSAADVYAAICPYVRAFPNGVAYHRWAERVPAATVGLPLEGATELAARLVE